MLAIIGGTGLSQFETLQNKTYQTVKTDYGKAYVTIAQLENKPVVFLARHADELAGDDGQVHKIAPHKINYRANIAALKSLGVTDIIAVNAVGGIHAELGCGAIVVPDQLIDYTYNREHTFFDGIDNMLQHIDFTNPFTEELRLKLQNSIAQLDLSYTDFGIYGCTQGPRLETAAEVQRLKRDGCDVVGMTAMPEAALAKELDINYTSLCLVVNEAAGLSDDIITMDDINRVLEQGIVKIKSILSTYCQFH